MSSDKILLLYGLMLKAEASYNAGATVAAATDGVMMAEPVEVPGFNYVHDGARGKAPGTGGLMKRGKQSGRSVEFTPKFEGRGAGAPYSATILPPDVAVGMRASAHSQTVVTTPGAEKVIFAPVSDKASMVSAAGEAYSRGQKWPLTGIYSDMAFSFEAGGYLMFDFPLSCLVGIPTDVAVPTITYSPTVPPKVENIGLAIGAWAAPVVRKGEFKANRKKSARASANAAGHAGFSPGHREPELTLTVEACPLSTFDPYTARELATALNVTFTVGSTQYNKVKFTAVQAQITNVAEESDEDTALWTLTFACPASTPTLNDDYSLEWS